MSLEDQITKMKSLLKDALLKAKKMEEGRPTVGDVLFQRGVIHGLKKALEVFGVDEV